MIKIPAFRGRNNREIFKVLYQNRPFNFDSFGVSKAELVCSNNLISSDNGDVKYAGDEISLQMGSLDLNNGFHQAQLVIYNDTNPNGLVIAGPGLASEIQIIAN